MKATIEKQKSKGGRPRIELTDAQLAELKIIAPVCTIKEAADYFGIALRTFEEIKVRDKEVSAVYKKAKIQAKAMVGGSLIKRALAGDTTAAIFYMKTQGGWREPKDEEEIQDKELKITVAIKENENIDNLKKFEELKSQIIKK